MPQVYRVQNFYNSDCEEDSYHQHIGRAVAFYKDDDYFVENYLDRFGDESTTYSQDVKEWQTKHVKEWNQRDIIQWLNSEADEFEVCCTELATEKFAQYQDGNQLLSLSSEHFSELDNKYGSILYKRLHDIALADNSSQYQPLNNARCMPYDEESLDEKNQNSIVCSLTGEPTLYGQEQPLGKKEKEEVESTTAPALSPAPAAPPKKKGPGRPKGSKRKKKTEKLGRLWEFLRDLLKDRRYCPSHIAWDNYEEGMFRFVHSDQVAKLWGSKKDNPDMNYEKLSRAMRYYYKSQVLLPVYGKRLVYKFGPSATGWRVENPNFAE